MGSRLTFPAPAPPPRPPPATSPLPRDSIGQEIDREILEQQAIAYVEVIHLWMIAQGIPFEVAEVVGDIGPGTRVPMFDRLGPPIPIPVCQVDLRPRL